jgi:hypothetical protein
MVKDESGTFLTHNDKLDRANVINFLRHMLTIWTINPSKSTDF